MERIDYYDLCKSRYTGLFKTDNGVYDAIIKTICDALNQYQDQYLTIFTNLLNIDNSSGEQLDMIGRIVGQDRTLADFVSTPYFGFEDAPLAQSFGTITNPAIGGKWRSITNPASGTNKLLADSEYRTLIKARILKNNSKGTLNDLLAVINLIDGSSTTFTSVNSNGDVTILLRSPTPILYYFLTKRNTPDSIIPIPLGVRTRVKII